jgi:myo-inositol-1(or 4)-monophosphatase
VVTDRLGAPIQFNAARPQAAGVVAAAPGLHGALLGGLVPQGERPG